MSSQQSNAFTKYGALIAGFLPLLMINHTGNWYIPTQTFQNLLNPSNIISTVFSNLFYFGMVFGTGYIPTWITGNLFFKLFGSKYRSANFCQILLYGFIVGSFWYILLIFFIIIQNLIEFWLVFVTFIILPTSMICAVIEWKKAKKLNITINF